MTFSILAFDGKIGRYGAAAATGSLCVGGWVLRGDAESGLSASQGTSPSTLWGMAALAAMKRGVPAAEAVERVVEADPGREHRQLAALGPDGSTGVFTGALSLPVVGSLIGPSVVVAGNMLANAEVVPAILSAFTAAEGTMAERLLAALLAGQVAGGDNRGLQSAALLVMARDSAPLSLRIDWANDPLADLGQLYQRSQTDPYRMWTGQVPTLDDPYQNGSEAGERASEG